MTKPGITAAALGALGLLVAATSARADAEGPGGELALGLGLAGGDSYARLDEASGRLSDGRGGGVVVDLSPRLWWGPLVVSATGMKAPGLFSAGESAAMAGLGAKVDLTSQTRVLALAERGLHQISGMGSGFATRSTASASLSCWSARLLFEAHGEHLAAYGFGVFLLRDLEQVDAIAKVDGPLDVHTERYRAGGYLLGAFLHAALGS